jgi:CheY-like chemotaxis protein
MSPTAPKQNVSRTLLIVDDEHDVLSAILGMLEHFDYRTITTTDPHYALHVLQTDRSIDLLVTDLFMPEMDGEVLLDQSRKIRPGLKVILTSGIASDQQIRRWRARGELVICKPWLEQDFIGAIQKALIGRP